MSLLKRSSHSSWFGQALISSWRHLLPPPTSSPDPTTATAQRVGGFLISDLSLNSRAFLGNLHSSGKGQQVLCVVAPPPFSPTTCPPSCQACRDHCHWPPFFSQSPSSLHLQRAQHQQAAGSTVRLMNSAPAHSEPDAAVGFSTSSCLGNKDSSTCPTTYNGEMRWPLILGCLFSSLL